MTGKSQSIECFAKPLRPCVESCVWLEPIRPSSTTGCLSKAHALKSLLGLGGSSSCTLLSHEISYDALSSVDADTGHGRRWLEWSSFLQLLFCLLLDARFADIYFLFAYGF